MNITRKDLVFDVSNDLFKEPEVVKPIVDSLFRQLVNHIVLGHTIELRGFGTFSICLRKGRPARNPKTGNAVTIPERYVPTLKFSTHIRKRIEKMPNKVNYGK